MRLRLDLPKVSCSNILESKWFLLQKFMKKLCRLINEFYKIDCLRIISLLVEVIVNSIIIDSTSGTALSHLCIQFKCIKKENDITSEIVHVIRFYGHQSSATIRYIIRLFGLTFIYIILLSELLTVRNSKTTVI